MAKRKAEAAGKQTPVREPSSSSETETKKATHHCDKLGENCCPL